MDPMVAHWVAGNIEKTGRGVYVQASTLGSLEALLEFLRTSKIPVSGISIGPVHRKDIVKASAQLEFRAMYATVMAFDVPVDKDAQEMADKVGAAPCMLPSVCPVHDRCSLPVGGQSEGAVQVLNDMCCCCAMTT